MVDIRELEKITYGKEKKQNQEENDFENFILNAVKEANKIYPPGLSEYLEENLPELNKKISQLEEKANEYYLNGDFENFKKATRKWYKCIKLAVEEYIPGENIKNPGDITKAEEVFKE